MAVKNLTINSVDFISEGNIRGCVDCFLAYVEDDSRLFTVKIWPQRNGKDVFFLCEDIYVNNKYIKLPTRIVSKLLRLTRDYDKLGKRSISL